MDEVELQSTVKAMREKLNDVEQHEVRMMLNDLLNMVTFLQEEISELQDELNV